MTTMEPLSTDLSEARRDTSGFTQQFIGESLE